ncbi:hypothetical protein [Prescottella agglutinans]
MLGDAAPDARHRELQKDGGAGPDQKHRLADEVREVESPFGAL